MDRDVDIQMQHHSLSLCITGSCGHCYVHCHKHFMWHFLLLRGLIQLCRIFRLLLQPVMLLLINAVTLCCCILTVGVAAGTATGCSMIKSPIALCHWTLSRVINFSQTVAVWCCSMCCCWSQMWLRAEASSLSEGTANLAITWMCLRRPTESCRLTSCM